MKLYESSTNITITNFIPYNSIQQGIDFVTQIFMIVQMLWWANYTPAHKNLNDELQNSIY